MTSWSATLAIVLLGAGGWAFAQERPTSRPAEAATAQTVPQPVPRSEAFFGLHFDLHPGKGDTALGAETSAENIAGLLTRVRPDFVQYDCKGHPGYTGYPTKIGWPSPGILQDALAVWRQVTREHGVGLYIHYSGVWDSAAIEHHPEWARLDESGKPDGNTTSVFGPYVDELLIPQLKEACAAYELDGVWADGECWAAKLDYSPAALAAWKQETGLDTAPKKRDDPHWLEWKSFHRRAFEKYLGHWVDALHAANPKLQLTSNWMYTTFAPKPIVAKLDFLSGDFVPQGAVDRARFDARYLANTGRPWDLMAWGFLWGSNVNGSMKTPVQLQQEAAIVISQGGGFQIYYPPTRTGYVGDAIIDVCGPVADFCRARQSVSHKSTSVPQVALLLGTEEQFDRSDAVFAPHGTSGELEGALHALLELHYSVDVLAEHQLQPRLADYPLIVLPDTYKLPDGFRDALSERVKNGGSLLLLGEKCARLFEPLLGVQFDGPPQPAEGELRSAAGLVNVSGVWQKVVLKDARPLGYRYPNRDTRTGEQVAATLVRCAKGQIAAIYGPVALQFYQAHHPNLRRFIGEVAAPLFLNPAVTTEAPPGVDLAVRRTRDGRPALHLVNLGGQPLGNRLVIDDIPAVGPFKVHWRLPEKPKSVRWLPDGDQVAWAWADGVLSATVPRLHIHGVLVVEP